MSGPAELSIAAGILADAGLKATVVLGFGWVATGLLRHASAAQRHAVWVCTFAGLPLLPWFAWHRGPEIALDSPWLVAVWALGAGVASLPIARGLIALASLRRAARPDPVAHDLLHSHHVTGPITWGVFRPVIVLPASAADWTPTHRDAALVHERAHIARRDWAVHMAVWMVCAAFWFHPFVWLARRALSREAEHAADDAVITAGIRPSDYAHLLLSFARHDTPHAALGVGTSLVGSRVRAILDHRSRSNRRWPATSVVFVLGALSLPSLGGWATWSAPPEVLTCLPGPLP